MVQGPVHDNALRLLSASDLVALCRWLGIDTSERSIRLSEALPAATRYVDLIAAVAPGRLAHAALAVLGRAATLTERAEILQRSVQVLAGLPDVQHRSDLAEVAAVLAGIHLDAATIEKQFWEVRMPITFEDTYPGREIRARVWAEAQAEGRTEGRTEGQIRTLSALLRRTFGDDPRIELLATALAALPEDQALDAALTSPSLDDLVKAHLPHP
jgi:predicted transposase YdaD